MKAIKEDKIIIKQFRDGSSDFWVNYAHYHLNKNNELIWCSGETDKEDLRNALLTFIRRNKKSFKEREPSIYETEEKKYSTVNFGKMSGKTTQEIVWEDKRYARWLYENSTDTQIKVELKELLKIK